MIGCEEEGYKYYTNHNKVKRSKISAVLDYFKNSIEKIILNRVYCLSLSDVSVSSHKAIHIRNPLNPVTPMSDQDSISPYNTNAISSRQVTRIKKNIN